MLKGIKKIGKQDNQQDKHQDQHLKVIKESKLKEQAIMEEEEARDQQGPRDSMDVLIKEQTQEDLARYQECYDLFLSGEVELLQQKLSNFKKKEMNQYEQKEQKVVKNNFEYHMNFAEEG